MTQKQFERGLSAALIVIALALFAVEARAQYTPVPSVKTQYFNGSVPCNGCKLYTYSAGTTTPLASYSDTSGTLNANPVILDSSGYGSIFLTGTGAYKLKLTTSADVLIWTVDQIAGYCPTIGCTIGTITGINGITVTSGGLSSSTSATSGQAFAANATGTGSTIGAFIGAASATGVALEIRNSNASGDILEILRTNGTCCLATITATGTSLNSTAITGTATVSTSLSIAGGTALTTTNQTGTGSIVMSASPAITGNMTYANTTPVANLTGQVLAYTTTGTQKTNSHMVYGGCTLGTDCAVTLSGSAVFTNANSYSCWAQDDTAAAATKIVYGSGSLFTITGTGTDVISFGCVGN